MQLALRSILSAVALIAAPSAVIPLSVAASAQTSLPACPPSDSPNTWTHCQGELSWPSGEKYVGEWRNGNMNGQGTLTTANGNYVGEFRNGKESGQGTYTFRNGKRYVGEWRDGKFNGQGILYLPDGTIAQSGLWADNKLAGSLRADEKIAVSSSTSKSVPLKSKGGAFFVSVLINGVVYLDFTVDSGATDVSIPADVVMTLARTGTITNADFLGKQIYRLADGSTVPSVRFVIRSLKIGDLTLQNVTGNIAPVKGGLLLGQSFLSRFKSWSIDNQRHVLVLD